MSPRLPKRLCFLLPCILLIAAPLLTACGGDNPPAEDPDVSADVEDTTSDATEVGTDVGADTETGDTPPDATPDSEDEPPTVSLDAPEDGSCVAGTVEILATAQDDGTVASVEFYVDDSAVGEATAEPFALQWDPADADDGAATIRAVATDDSGLTAEDSVTVQLDQTPPTLAIISPLEADGPIFRTLVVQADVQDDGGVTDLVITLTSDGHEFDPATLTEEPWEATFDVSDVDGSVVISVVATDCGGATGSAEATVEVLPTTCDGDEDGVASTECGGSDCDDADDTITSNECGGCHEFEEPLGAACGTCGGGVWACSEEGGVTCSGDLGFNGCGGCEVLDEEVGGSCDCGDEWCAVVCDGADATTCVSAETPLGYVRVWPGTFTMGSPADEYARRPDERQHEVTLTRAFFFAEHEITQGAWEDFADNNPAEYPGCDTCPIERVNYWDAVAFANSVSESRGLPPCYELIGCTGRPGDSHSCEGVELTTPTVYECAGYRLPTEAEWEWAARAGTTGATYIGEIDRRDCTSHIIGRIAWFCGNTERPRPVGLLEPNPWGIYDVLGNVFEWTSDWYGEYPSDPVVDPVGLTTGEQRAARGGAWDFAAGEARSARRLREGESTTLDHIGFRLARSAPGYVPPGFVRVPSGSFTMGSRVGERGREVDEVQHEVTLTRAFYMSQHETTQAEWRDLIGNNPSEFGGCDDCPVENINYWDAVSYANEVSAAEGLETCYELFDCTGSPGFELACAGVGFTTETPYDCEGYRLPTEAEWEWAARAGTTQASYAGELDETGCDSEVLDEIAWYCGNAEQTEEVGQLMANDWGIYDILGNVFEWTSDWYAEYPDGDVTDPFVVDPGPTRVARGGAWDFSAEESRAAHRGAESDDTVSDHIGLRLVRTAH